MMFEPKGAVVISCVWPVAISFWIFWHFKKAFCLILYGADDGEGGWVLLHEEKIMMMMLLPLAMMMMCAAYVLIWLGGDGMW